MYFLRFDKIELKQIDVERDRRQRVKVLVTSYY